MLFVFQMKVACKRDGLKYMRNKDKEKEIIERNYELNLHVRRLESIVGEDIYVNDRSGSFHFNLKSTLLYEVMDESYFSDMHRDTYEEISSIEGVVPVTFCIGEGNIEIDFRKYSTNNHCKS